MGKSLDSNKRSLDTKGELVIVKPNGLKFAQGKEMFTSVSSLIAFFKSSVSKRKEPHSATVAATAAASLSVIQTAERQQQRIMSSAPVDRSNEYRSTGSSGNDTSGVKVQRKKASRLVINLFCFFYKF
jgi:hypothetical protein